MTLGAHADPVRATRCCDGPFHTSRLQEWMRMRRTHRAPWVPPASPRPPPALRPRPHSAAQTQQYPPSASTLNTVGPSSIPPPPPALCRSNLQPPWLLLSTTDVPDVTSPSARAYTEGGNGGPCLLGGRFRNPASLPLLRPCLRCAWSIQPSALALTRSSSLRLTLFPFVVFFFPRVAQSSTTREM